MRRTLPRSFTKGVIDPLRRTPLLLTLALVAAFAVQAAPASASKTQFSLFEDNGYMLNGAARGGALDFAQSYGVQTIRIAMLWSNVAPSAGSKTRPSFDATNPAAYGGGFAPYDEAINAIKARGIGVMLTVTGPVPKWATKSKRDNLTNPSSKEYGQFMTAVGRRYGGLVDYWTLWNEPNHPKFLKPQFKKVGKRKVAVSPGIYRKLFIAGQKGLAASGYGNKPVLLGDTAPVGNFQVVAPLAFLRGTLCLTRSYRKSKKCGKLNVAGYAHHPYTKASGPTYRSPNRDDVTIGTLSRLTSAVSRAGRAGAIPRGIRSYNTEFGVQSRPDPFAATLDKQATYIGIAERQSYNNRGIASYSQYLLQDEPARKGGSALTRYSGFESGLRMANGQNKPSYEAYRLPLAVDRRGHSGSVSIWGYVRPTHAASNVVVVYRDKGSKTVKTLKSFTTDSRGYFKFNAKYKSGRRWQLRWSTFGGHFVEAY
jgi:hypothetical protein